MVTGWLAITQRASNIVQHAHRNRMRIRLLPW
jgi:hypothetical protein